MTNEYAFNLENFKTNISEINKNLEAQSELTSLHKAHSSEYRDSLKKEIELLELKANTITDFNNQLEDSGV